MPTTKLGKCTWGGAEVRAVLSGALHLASPEASRAALTQALDRLGYKHAPLLVNRASVGLRLALEEMRAQRPDRSVVVVPAYCCPSVPSTVRAAGLNLRAGPVTPDLNLDLDRLAPLLKNDVLAVVGVHMYALPLDMARLKALAGAAGAFTVDDAAHMVAAPHGLQGDVGLLSFNQSKTLTGGSPHGGGALFVTNEDLRASVARRHASLPEGKSRARNYVWFALRFGIEVTPRALTEYIGDLDIPLAWTTSANYDGAEKMSASAALAVCAQIERLEQILAGRTAVARRYLNALREHKNLEFVQTQAPRYLSRMMVRWNAGPAAGDVRERLARRGFATRMPYPMWTADDDPTADFIRKLNATHLELPGSPRLVANDIEELVTALSLCLKSP